MTLSGKQKRESGVLFGGKSVSDLFRRLTVELPFHRCGDLGKETGASAAHTGLFNPENQVMIRTPDGNGYPG